MPLPDAQMISDMRAAPEAVRRQEAALAEVFQALAERLRRKPPQLVVTCARGSSAHAATFGKHLIERYLGTVVAAAAPSVTTIYHQPLRLADQLFLAISQSGESSDIVEQAASARAGGAVTACITNDPASALARACEFVAPMAAGPELSIPATKTFIASVAALARLVASWAEDEALAEALRRLPDRLAAAGELDWSRLLDSFTAAESLVTIGRGPTLAIAREAALKLKETSDLHAEAFSAAEFLHGPIALVAPSYPVLMFAPTDAAAVGMTELAADLRAKGAAAFITSTLASAPDRLPALPDDHPETDAICLIQSFYAMVVRLAAMRGTNVDKPRHLRKITRTR
ncbi:SIS domain-containing protein [Methylocystis sp. IM3]|uniref:SIS domain-containing protein n=1 Tax=unclassified Methylocystis TaxID=2625913 RepID=UPI000F9C4E1E|nr:MAG: SIS domain-containing protein [Hyphomicrobiales bacterium]